MSTIALSFPQPFSLQSLRLPAAPVALAKPTAQRADTVTLSSAPRAEATAETRAAHGTRPAWLDRLSFFATDAVDAGRIFTVAGAAGWLGQVAQLSSVVWGPVFAGIGLAAGGVQMATSAFAKDPAVRRDRVITGGLEMLTSGAALVSTLGLAPAYGAAATIGLIGVKFVYDMLSRTAAPPPPKP